MSTYINVPQAVEPKLSAANTKSKLAKPVALASPEWKAVVPKLKASESELKLAELVATVEPAAQEQMAAELCLNQRRPRQSQNLRRL